LNHSSEQLEVVETSVNYDLIRYSALNLGNPHLMKPTSEYTCKMSEQKFELVDTVKEFKNIQDDIPAESDWDNYFICQGGPEGWMLHPAISPEKIFYSAISPKKCSHPAILPRKIPSDPSGANASSQEVCFLVCF